MNVKRLQSLFRLAGLDALILGAASAGLGILTGMEVYGNRQQVESIIDPTPYQNFAVFTGALTGLITCILFVALYFLITRRLLHHTRFHQRFYLITSGIAGMAIGIATFGIVNALAASYGMLPATGSFFIIDGLICALIGAAVGVITGLLLSMIRGYNS